MTPETGARHGRLLVLVHSPLTGPLTWQPVARVLTARGYSAVVPSLVEGLMGPRPYYPRLAARVAEAVLHEALGAREAVLIGHSGAGAILPAAAAALPCRARASIFVDAILPHPGRSWLNTVPPALGQTLRGQVQDGYLPPWHQWFPAGTIETLLPDSSLREAFVSRLPQVPVAYVEERAPVVPGPTGRPGYLQLSAAYEAMADQAERQGWPTLRESADHLAMLTAPELIADRIDELIGMLAPAP